MADAPLWTLAHLALAYTPGPETPARAVAPLMRLGDITGFPPPLPGARGEEGKRMDDAELAGLQHAVQVDPANREARLALLHGLLAAQRWQDAEELGGALLQSDPVPAVVHTCMGIIYGKQARWEEAVQQCRLALALQPDDALTLFNLAHLLVRQDDGKAALECLEQAITHAPDWAEAQYTHGTLLLTEERYQEAVRAFDRALEYRTIYPEAHFNRGNAYALRALNSDGSLDYYELDCAVNAYKMAIQQQPGYAAALYNLGMLYKRMGSAEGLRVWNQYLEATQDLPDEELWRLRAQEYLHDQQDRLR
ncbi:MAG: tetratricopeptide repeat protein [Candidatus Tectomicrobia bacterium]|uniref:Tetratricopeptide repeat protein n=1 Tax=Tectimicrobiota bacterium TaxID=2528274 RepID=A0A937W326_UNCTE|nr:tetratricopeptide repeat protein [Candidatus Tectomicrobia bacterium]